MEEENVLLCGSGPLGLTGSGSSEETRLKLWNVSSSKNVLQLPSIFHHLPHLLSREDSLQPAIHLGQGRTGGKIHRLLNQYLEQNQNQGGKLLLPLDLLLGFRSLFSQ